MMAPSNLSSLYTSTDDPGAASTGAVVRPQPGAPPIRWYRDTKPRFYRPYLIRVLWLDDTTMHFVFLNSQTGADLPMPPSVGPHYKIAYHDGRYAYSALPSTAQDARPGNEQSRSCGLLFISDLYMEKHVPQSVRTMLTTPRTATSTTALAGRSPGDSKWPYSAGTSSEPSTPLHAEPGVRPSPQAATDLAQLARLRKSGA